jgi:ATP-dependent protease ClpP protease subunit
MAFPVVEGVEEKKAEINIISDIGKTDGFMSFFGESAFGLSNFNEFLDQNREANHIQINIHSCGGLLNEAYALHDKAKVINKHITTCIEGECYSAATVVQLSGKDRQMYENASIIIHEPMRGYCEYLNATEMAQEQTDLQAETDKLIDFYCNYLTISREKVVELMAKEQKINANEALEYGFITEIIKTNGYINKINDKMNAKFEAFLEKFDAFIAKFKPEPVAMVRKDTAGNELTFTKSEGEPAVGDECSPDGEFVMDNGNTIVVAGGKITEIIEPEAEQTEAEVQLAAAQAKIVDLETQLQAKHDAEAEMIAKRDEYTAMFTELSEIKSKYCPAGREENFEDKTDPVQTVEAVKAEMRAKKEARKK